MEIITRAPKVVKLLSETTSNGETAFPWKLHILLEQSERQGFEDTISWEGDRAFKVHDPKKFEDSVMKEYFNQTQYKSFQRQRKYCTIAIAVKNLVITTILSSSISLTTRFLFALKQNKTIYNII